MPTVSVHPVRASTFVYPAEHPEGPGVGEIYVYCIRTPAGTFLVDTGIGSGHAWIDEHYRPSGFDLLGSLRDLGVDPGSIRAVICSHLHFDHCGNNKLFAGLPVYVQRAEYDAAVSGAYTVLEWLQFPGADYRQLDGSLRLNEWVEILPTPGHTAGHQSVAVSTLRGLEIVVAQAAYSAAEFAAYASGNAPVRCDAWSTVEYARSLNMLHKLKPTRAYFSHDSTVWREA